MALIQILRRAGALLTPPGTVEAVPNSFIIFSEQLCLVGLHALDSGKRHYNATSEGAELAALLIVECRSVGRERDTGCSPLLSPIDYLYAYRGCAVCCVARVPDSRVGWRDAMHVQVTRGASNSNSHGISHLVISASDVRLRTSIHPGPVTSSGL